jgi:SAM-dependent methyltransferase
MLSAGVPLECKSVLEFGAGLGQNLSILRAETKWAVDLGEHSRKACLSKGIPWSSVLDDVPDNHFDVVISRHSLEHVDDPLRVLRALHSKLKEDGQFFLIVPYETMEIPRLLSEFDEHTHLFSWSPNTIKNLVLKAGWRIKRVKINNGVLFRRSLSLLRLGHAPFLSFRLLMDRLPLRSAEIGLQCIK